MYREREKKHPPVSLYESYLQNKVFEHLRFSAVNVCILTCPGETSGGTPSNTLATPISKSTTQIAGSLLLVRASPQSSQYKLLSWLGIGTHVPPKETEQESGTQTLCCKVSKTARTYVRIIPFSTRVPHLAFRLMRSCFSPLRTAVCSHTLTTTGSQTGLKINTCENKRLFVLKIQTEMDAEQYGSTVMRPRPWFLSVSGGDTSGFHLTVVIHSTVFVKSSQVEAFSEAVAVPYLNRHDHKQQPVKMLERRHYKMKRPVFLTSRSWWPLVSLITALRPRMGENPLNNLKK